MRTALALALVLATAGTASADPSKVIYLNRCVGGCTITKAAQNNSISDASWFPEGDGTFQLTEFAWDDATWNAMVQCVKDVYAPYDIEVTDVDPGQATHDEVYCAGLSSEINQNAGGLGGGKSPSGSSYCSTATNNVSFAFLNGFPPDNINEMCGVVAQESGHSFGMPDHVADCRDPMSFGYHGPCGGTPRGFFRDHLVSCANVGSTVCTCGGNKVNDHQHLIGVLGANPDFEDDTPQVTINNASDGDPLSESTAFSVSASSHRGVYRMEVYLNGWLWGSWDAPEAPSFGDQWPIPAAIVKPDAGFPDGNYDVEIRAYDDLGTPGSAHVMMTKGSPCTDASQCLDGQQCTNGGCVWDQPSGQLGDPCTFDQACVGPNIYDGMCFDDGSGDAYCSRPCFGGPNDDCGDGYACAVMDTGDNSGVCEPASATKPGCCSTGGGPPTGALALGALISALVLRRKRR